MAETQKQIAQQLLTLFQRAETNGETEYIHTLVRVEGITSRKDPLLELREKLSEDITGMDNQELVSHYCGIATNDEPLRLVANLLCCARKEPYDLSPFRHLNKGQFPNTQYATQSEKVQELTQWATNDSWVEFAQFIREAYPEEIVSSSGSNATPLSAKRVKDAFRSCGSFLTELLNKYFEEKLKFRDFQRFFKMPGFEVLELLVDTDAGLYGFKMHFSNGSSAEFARYSDRTSCTNVVPGTPINFMVGDLNARKHEWRVGQKRLYEIGLPGRYNKTGEWKPIIYPRNADALVKEAMSLAEEDDVQGTLFYMFCTGHRGIEFVVRTSVELPEDYIRFGEKFHLWKCQPLGEGQRSANNSYIYDGWYELESTDVESIKSAIATIGVGVNRLAFAYGASATWRVKYRTVVDTEGYATPTKEDLSVLDSLLKIVHTSQQDAIVIESAIDWYNRGRSIRNVFARFLCYYISIESICLAVTAGHADLGLSHRPKKKEERRQEQLDCITQKYSKTYAEDPIRFVNESYLECIYGITRKVRSVTELVFGSQHPYLDSLFQKRDGHSLSSIRSSIAHGEFTLFDREHQALVKNQVSEMSRIAKAFLTRIMFKLTPGDPLPKWSGLHKASYLASDPRTAMYASDERVFPTTDWRIRAEWCE